MEERRRIESSGEEGAVKGGEQTYEKDEDRGRNGSCEIEYRARNGEEMSGGGERDVEEK